MEKKYIDKIALIDIKGRAFLGALSIGKDTWYVPGGKREAGENDEQTLIREIKEELTINIIPRSLQLFGIYEAQAHGKPEGTLVRNTCYLAKYRGRPQPSNEIAKIGYFTSKDRESFSEVNQIMIADLVAKGFID